MRFVLVRSSRPWRGERWRWRIVAANNEVLASSELYHNRDDALAAMQLVRDGAVNAHLEDTTL
jgi:uncharacterized protein YegP (UPF0339 family)